MVPGQNAKQIGIITRYHALMPKKQHERFLGNFWAQIRKPVVERIVHHTFLSVGISLITNASVTQEL